MLRMSEDRHEVSALDKSGARTGRSASLDEMNTLDESGVWDGRGPSIDEDVLFEALSGLAGDAFWPGGVVAQSGIAGRFLAGELDGASAVALMEETGFDWTPLLGRLGAVAYRAAWSGIADAHREALRGLLEFWAD